MIWTQAAPAVAGALVTVFLATYLLLARWWRSQEGQNVVLLSALIMTLAAIGMIRRAGLGDLADTLAGLAWAGVAIDYAWRTGLLLRAQGVLNRRRRPPAD